MSWLPDRYRALRALIWGERPADDLAEEFAAHLAMRTEDLVARGLAPEAARREALRRFGEVETYRRETLAIDEKSAKEHRRMESLRGIGRDARLALRSLARTPVFAVVAVATLALGIGATTAIFAVLDGVVLRPLPYGQPERLVSVGTRWPGVKPDMRVGVSPAMYFYFRDESRTLSGIGVYLAEDFGNVTGDGPAERVPIASVTPDVFGVLGVKPYLGRLFTPEDARPADLTSKSVVPDPAAPVAVLSYGFWQRRYGGDRSIVGRTIGLGGHELPVVGVLPPGVRLPDTEADVFLPLTLNPAARPTNWHTFHAVARLRDGATAEGAQAELERFKGRFVELFPSAYSDDFMRSTGFAVDVTGLHQYVVGAVAGRLWIVLGAVGLVLLIACANVANLFLVRAESRSKESAIRASLGAGRAHLARFHLVESLLVSLAAGAIGLVLAAGGIRVLVAFAPAWLPRLDAVGIGAASVAVAAALSLLAGAAFGFFPLLRAAPVDAVLRGGRGQTPSRHQHAFRGALVVAETALALVLLAAAGVMLRSFVRLLHVDPGVEPRGVVTLQLSLPYQHYDGYEKVAEFYRQLTSRVEALPGVRAAGLISALPLGVVGETSCGAALVVEDRPGDTCVAKSAISPGIAQALGIRVRGRVPDWSDVQNNTGAVLVSRAFAERLWPGEDPIGKGVRGNGRQPPYYRVVGVTEGVHFAGLDMPPEEMVYFPLVPLKGAGLWQEQWSMTLVVRAAGDRPLALVPALRRAVAALDPEVPLGEIRSMERVVADSMARTSFLLLLLGVAAGMALLLSAVGLYGVISYIVGQRRSEIGVRMALGARMGEVARMVMAQSARLALGGIALGLVGAFATTRVLRSLLFDVSPSDPVVLIGVSLVLALVALAASYLPARRAARVDPVEALRAE